MEKNKTDITFTSTENPDGTYRVEISIIADTKEEREVILHNFLARAKQKGINPDNITVVNPE